MITSANATFQMSVAPAMRGRVMALYMMVFMGGTPIGSPIVGWVGQTFGARWTLIGGGAATILGTAARGRGVQPRPGPDRARARPGRGRTDPVSTRRPVERMVGAAAR